MDNKVMTLGSAILSVAACILAVTALRSGDEKHAAAPVVETPDPARIESLQEQIAQLRAEVTRIAKPQLAEPGARTEREVVVTPISLPPDVVNRLAAIESSVAKLQDELRAFNKSRTGLASPKETDLREAQLVATDPRTSEKDKLAALKALRGAKIDGKDASSPDVVLAMIALAEQSADEDVRTDVYRNMHGVKDNALRDSMLRALAGDPSAKVRMKVAQDIDTFLADALVVSALHQAADHDADLGVRGQALKTLAGAR